MLGHASRLTNERDYATVYRRGRRLRARGFGCLVLGTPTSTRIGVVVSKKVSLKATARNRYKRWFWAALRELKGGIPAKGYSIVLAANPGMVGLTYHDVRAELQRLMRALPH